MIYVIEFFWESWQHRLCNAGLIKQISEALGESEITVVAKIEHLKILKNEIYDRNVNFTEISRGAYKFNSADINNGEEIVSTLREVLGELSLKDKDTVFLCSSTRGLLDAVRIESRNYKRITFYSVMHAFAEKVIDDTLETDTHNSLKTSIKKYCGKTNLFLIHYSPKAIEKYEKIFSRRVMNHMFYSNHPLLNDSSEDGTKEMHQSRIEIAVWGQALNSHAIEIINTCCRKKLDFLHFNILTRNEKIVVADSYGMLDVCMKSTGFSDEEIEALIRKSDWILIAYDKNQYRVSASGVFADALNYRKPIISLDSPYIVYYNNLKNVGIVCDTVAEIVSNLQNLKQVNNEDYKKYVDNIDELTQILHDDNMDILKQRLRI